MRRFLFGALAAALLLGSGLALAYRGGYPSIDYDLIFSHRSHLARETTCETCHANALTSTTSEDNLLPKMALCLECHNGQKASDACELCHVNASNLRPTVRPPVHPEFDHKAHMQRGAACADCHARVETAGMAGPEHLPPMEACWRCHDGTRAASTCDLCHAGVKDLKPPSHRAAFGHTHQFLARGSTERCEMCHARSQTCSECHEGENVSPATHDRNFLFTHPVDVQQHAIECTSCHRMDSFCSDCHLERGIRSAEHFLPEWVSAPGTRNLHADRARRDIGFCASCHEEDSPTCVQCHADPDNVRGTQAGYDIHPPGFARDAGEGPWHDDAGYFCFSCHQNVTRQAGVGFCGYCHGAAD